MSATRFNKIGRYHIGGLVGEGSTATVYKAHDPAIDRTVAIKLLKTEYSANAQLNARFQREARSAGAISHPNIVTIYDVGVVAGKPYIAMEFLEQQSLASVLAEGKRLPVQEVIAIGIQLAKALDYAHRRGVVHRDIKPANILLDRDGTAKIADFGIARLAEAEEVQTTQVGTVLGTPRYMSPEQISGQAADGRSDLYSLGAVLYELVTGTVPFQHDNLAFLLVQILQKDPPPPSHFNPSLPGGIDRIVMSLLNKKPEQRFQTGRQVADALEREMQAILEAERSARRERFLPLRVKLALRASGALALIFLAFMTLVYDEERSVLRAQALVSGAALARFVAVETAVPVLAQNWEPLKLFVQDAKARGSFDYLAVVDHGGIVQAATDARLLGRSYAPLPGTTLAGQPGAMAVSSSRLQDGRAAFMFATPILFQSTPIGRLYLGIDQGPTNRVLNEIVSLLGIVGLLCIAAVGSLSWLFGAMLARPMRLLRDALQAFAGGELDRRISERRHDELGEIFEAYNGMADAVQQRHSIDKPLTQEQLTPGVQFMDVVNADQLATLIVPEPAMS